MTGWRALKGLLFCSVGSSKTIKNNPFLAGSARFVTIEPGALDVILDIPLVLMNSDIDCKLSIAFTNVPFTGISKNEVTFLLVRLKFAENFLTLTCSWSSRSPLCYR